MLPRPTTTVYNPGDNVAKDFVLAAIPHYRYHAEHYFDRQLLESGSYRTAKLTADCPAPGDYELNGFSRVRWHRSVWDTLPWYFKYRVIGKGASLILDAHQYCYRCVPNPIAVSIPGYPPGKIKLWSKQEKLVHREGVQWEIFITDTTVDKIIVYADATDVHGHTATVHAAEYAIKDLDGLRLTIDGSEPTIMPAADMLKAHSIQATDGVSGFTLRVISYDLVIINAENKEVGTFYINKNMLDPDSLILKKALLSLTPGAHIYFCNVLTEHNISIPGAGITIE